MSGIITFASSEGVPLIAQPLFNLGPLTITNAMFFGAITGLVVLVIFAAAARKTQVRPATKFTFGIEQLVDFILNMAQQNFGGDRKKAIKHLPLLLTLFTFILVSNISGLLPGVGTVTLHDEPLLRAFTTDLNGTLALAVLSIGLVQFYALRELGLIGHLKHYFTDKPWNPMNFLIGIIEVMGEFIRIITLSMRLFGVIYAGEVLLHVVSGLAGDFGWAATLPVYAMEIFFSGIQAYIFVMLVTVYLSLATSHGDESHPAIEDHSGPLSGNKPHAAVIK